MIPLIIMIGLIFIPIGVVSVDSGIGTGRGNDHGLTPREGIDIGTDSSQRIDTGMGTDTNPHPVSAVPLDLYLKNLGASLVANDQELQSASDIEKAKVGFREYLKLLSNAGEGNSNDVWGRMNDLFHDERTTFTCSAHTQNLRDLFEAMGIDPRSIGQISGEMSTINPLNVNSDHGALVLIAKDGGRYVFDAWAHATDRDSWSPFDDLYGEGDRSAFNGMDIDSWNNMMRNAGYTSFLYQPSDGVESKEVPTAGMAIDSVASPSQIKEIDGKLAPATSGGKLNCDGAPAINGVGCWRIYDNGSSLQTGHWTYYFDSGLKLKSSEGDYENGLKVGHWTVYNAEGTKISEVNLGSGEPSP